MSFPVGRRKSFHEGKKKSFPVGGGKPFPVGGGGTCPRRPPFPVGCKTERQFMIPENAFVLDGLFAAAHACYIDLFVHIEPAQFTFVFSVQL